MEKKKTMNTTDKNFFCKEVDKIALDLIEDNCTIDPRVDDKAFYSGIVNYIKGLFNDKSSAKFCKEILVYIFIPEIVKNINNNVNNHFYYHNTHYTEKNFSDKHCNERINVKHLIPEFKMLEKGLNDLRKDKYDLLKLTEKSILSRASEIKSSIRMDNVEETYGLPLNLVLKEFKQTEFKIMNDKSYRSKVTSELIRIQTQGAKS